MQREREPAPVLVQRTRGGKLSHAEVLDMYKRAWNGESALAISVAYENRVKPRLIQYIKAGKVWGWLTKHNTPERTAELAARGFAGQGGQRHGHSVFSATQALDIYERAWAGESLTALAVAYSELLGRKIRPSRIYSIKSGQTWAAITGHVSPPAQGEAIT